MAVRLRQLLILSRDVARSTRFYEEGLGLVVIRQSDTFTELDMNAGVTLSIKQAKGYEECGIKYSMPLFHDIYILVDIHF
jgi:catechol-2,3-dioxygenase